MEKWKAVKGYEGIYEVSNLGNVRSLDRFDSAGRELKGRIMKLTNSRGYLQVWLCKNGKKKMFKAHRLVAIAFIENPDNLPHAGHQDDDKLKNNVNNLYWTDAKENNTHNGRHLRGAAKKSKEVFQYDKNNNFLKRFTSAAEIQRQLGYGRGDIGECCKGKYKTAYGYIWGYAKDN